MRLLPMMLQSATHYETSPSDSEMLTMMTEYDIQPVFPDW